VFSLCSPGFLKDDFMVYYESECIRRGETEMSRNKTKFVKAHASSGHRRALDEILSDPALQNQLSNVKAADEVNIILFLHSYDLL
jgi:protein pelota